VALNAATKPPGADYAGRVGRSLNQYVFTREKQVRIS
jgi:hypothetical protein